MRRVANSGGVGAFAVAQAAPNGRRQRGPRVRRSASARRRARQRAGLEPYDDAASATTGTSGSERGSDYYYDDDNNIEMINPDSLITANVEIDSSYGGTSSYAGTAYYTEGENNNEPLGFWQLDKADKCICWGICVLIAALIVILAVGMSTK